MIATGLVGCQRIPRRCSSESLKVTFTSGPRPLSLTGRKGSGRLFALLYVDGTCGFSGEPGGAVVSLAAITGSQEAQNRKPRIIVTRNGVEQSKGIGVQRFMLLLGGCCLGGRGFRGLLFPKSHQLELDADRMAFSP